jgi:DNA-binding transcriptional MerR regulator
MLCESGRRRCSPEVFERLAAFRLGQAAGFTIKETRLLLEGASEGGAASAHWHQMARHKAQDLRLQIERLQVMVGLLEEGMACGRVNLERCQLLRQP